MAQKKTDVNPICGRPNCKYKVAHEHVRFGSEAVALSPAKWVRPPPTYNEDVIEKALQDLPCQDDPSATRFTKEPEPIPQWITILSTRMCDVQNTTHDVKNALENIWQEIKADEKAIAACRVALLARSPLSFWQVLAASILGSIFVWLFIALVIRLLLLPPGTITDFFSVILA